MDTQNRKSPAPEPSCTRSVLVVLLLASSTVLAQSAEALRQAGLTAYRASDYARACPLLRKAAEADSTHGAIWADLGLCELKRGKQAESIRASTLAVLHGDEKIRLAAYFNLGLAGVNLAPQGVTSDGSCVPVELPKELDCEKRIAACGHAYQGQSYTYNEEQSSGLLLQSCDGTCPSKSPLGGHCTVGQDSCLEPDIVLSSESTLRGMGATPEWSCKASEAVKARAAECPLKTGADAKACERKACQDARRWQKAEPGSRAEWQELQEELESWSFISECKSCAESTTEKRCTVVSIDPCARRAGIVCTVYESSRDSNVGSYSSERPKTVAEEVPLQLGPIPRPGAGP